MNGERIAPRHVRDRRPAPSLEALRAALPRALADVRAELLNFQDAAYAEALRARVPDVWVQPFVWEIVTITSFTVQLAYRRLASIYVEDSLTGRAVSVFLNDLSTQPEYVGTVLGGAGTQGHFKRYQVNPSDDVVSVTFTVTGKQAIPPKQLSGFLSSESWDTKAGAT